MAVVPLRFKRIYTFNIRNDTFLKQLIWNDTESYTDNIYDSLGPEKTRFTFSSFVHGYTGPFWNLIFSILGQTSLLKEIFRINQDNIKVLAESLYRKTEYQRPHPYDQAYYKGNLNKPVPPGDEVDTPKLTQNQHDDMLSKFPPMY